MLKKILRWLLLIFLVLILFNLKLIIYGFQQLSGQLHIVLNTRPVSEILNAASTDELTQKKLLLIADARKFAVDSLGLKETKNYTTFYDQDNKPVLWVVTGAKQYSMEAYQWHFPFLGYVSYKGFFKKERADDEEKKMKQKNYDTDISTVGGWSTLGFFTDPILSNMLKRQQGTIADLIIHEMTHATVYLKDSVDYNENLATFIGEKGAEKFLRYKFPNDSSLLIKYRNTLQDEQRFGEYVLHGKQILDSLYKTFETGSLSNNDKVFLKYKTITYILLEIKNLNLHNSKRYEWDFKNQPLPNNTWFLSYSRYRKNQTDFEKTFKEKYNSNLREFISSVK